MNAIRKKLKSNLKEYHGIIEDALKNFWKEHLICEDYQKKEFLNIFQSSREVFLAFCKENQLNYSSIAGTIQEWTIFHFLKTGLSITGKNKIACVINRHPIPFKWKYKGNKWVNLDIAIKNIKTKKLYFAVEVKTNFEDGFEKYINEEKAIYHHRQKNFKHFKYYYLSLTLPPKIIQEKFSSKITTLSKREELYILGEDSNGLPGVNEFLKSIVQSILSIK